MQPPPSSIIVLFILWTLPHTVPGLRADERVPLSLVQTITNSLDMRFALIPAGEFLMGSPDRDAEPDERPQHRVAITGSFYLGIHEVTQAEFERAMGVNPSWFSAHGPGRAKVTGKETGRHPVDMVSADDAIAFCVKLSALPEESRAQRVYRLPTEAEWEYACRGGTTTRFSTGDSLAANQACFTARSPAFSKSRASDRDSTSAGRPQTTMPVGSYAPNPFGLYDMHGNVWEWCADWYAHDDYNRSPATDPRGPADGGFGRVVRGGAFNFDATHCRSANRDFTRATRRDLGNGFRVVCEIKSPMIHSQKKESER